MGRRGMVSVVVAVGAALVLAGCGGDDGGEKGKPNAAAAVRVGHDVAPVKRLFPDLGEVSEVTWVNRALGAGADAKARVAVPGPTDYAFDGVAHLQATSVAALVMLKSDWTDKPITCQVPEELKAEIGNGGTWSQSEQFDRSVTKGHYSGSFYLDRGRGRVFFCTTNPKEPAPVG